jgi:tetratricopeptide (TPR) repeat protein
MILRTMAGALLLACAPAVPALAGDVAGAVALYQQGKFAEAEAALKAEPGGEAKAYLAASLAKQKKHGEAEAAAKAALEAAPNHDVAVGALGDALVGQKKYDEAVDKLSAVIKAKADVPYAYYWRAQAYYNKKQADRMVADYETFLKLAPKYPEAASVQQLLSSLK